MDQVISRSIEVELRCFLERVKYDQLISWFSAHAEAQGHDEQVTYYFSGPHDLRIQKNKAGAKLCLKRGTLHDTAREELEVPVRAEDFETLEQIFETLGYEVSIKWYRTRHTFLWEGVTVTVDDTRGYGCVLELEQMTSADQKENALTVLRKRFKTLGIEPTPREEFERRFAAYKQNWKKLIA